MSKDWHVQVLCGGIVLNGTYGFLSVFFLDSVSFTMKLPDKLHGCVVLSETDIFYC